jgi:ubiquinone/menaquinone biosynthesis C-methylase UbiE
LKEIITTKAHYDILIDQNNDPVQDPIPLQVYMNKWDGETFLKELNINPESRVFELGIGTGRLAINVLNLGCKSFVGIDLSAKTIKRAQNNLNEFNNVEFIIGDFLETKIDQTFDVLYSSLTFFHIEKKEEAIEKIFSMLNLGGRFVLSIDKNPSEYFDYETHLIKLYPDYLDSTKSMLNKAGFIVDNISEIEFAYIITALKKEDL